jgi:hypothetical protein
MCVARTARRKRKQAANGYRHLAPLRRPKFSKVDAGKSRRRELAKVEKIKAMQQRKKK